MEKENDINASDFDLPENEKEYVCPPIEVIVNDCVSPRQIGWRVTEYISVGIFNARGLAKL